MENNEPVDLEIEHRYGLPALFEELESQGISESDVFGRAQISTKKTDPNYHERISIFRAAQSLAVKPATALLAGGRQKVSYYGAYGYVLATSATFGDAMSIAANYFRLSGSVLRVSLEIDNGTGVWRSHEPESLGGLLPFVAEYWRSSQVNLFNQILPRRFPSLHLSFPYPAPKHKSLYRQVFGCPVSFESEVMEWRFDADVLNEPCVDADPNVAKLCQHYCDQFLKTMGSRSELQRELQRACIAQLSSGKLAAPNIAAELHMSLRTFYRRLESEGINFQELVDQVKRAVAIEYLSNTELKVEEIAHRCNYQDVSNFRKAFRRWTGRTPSSYR